MEKRSGARQLRFVYQCNWHFQRNLSARIEEPSGRQQYAPSRQIQRRGELQKLLTGILLAANEERYGDGQTIPLTAVREPFRTTHSNSPCALVSAPRQPNVRNINYFIINSLQEFLRKPMAQNCKRLQLIAADTEASFPRRKRSYFLFWEKNLRKLTQICFDLFRSYAMISTLPLGVPVLVRHAPNPECQCL